jgi:hypothetical protein
VRGVRSVTDGGAGEAIGTSFAAPLVSRILANIYHQVTPPPSPVLSRAILTHHARDSRTGGRVADTEENFIGFGLPAPLPYCLECTPSTSTMIFEDVLRPGCYLEWDDFPYPDSLKRSGRYYGMPSQACPKLSSGIYILKRPLGAHLKARSTAQGAVEKGACGRLSEQVCDRQLKRIRKLHEGRKPQVFFAAFDCTGEGASQTALMCELFLRPVALLSQLPYSSAELFSDYDRILHSPYDQDMLAHRLRFVVGRSVIGILENSLCDGSFSRGWAIWRRSQCDFCQRRVSTMANRMRDDPSICVEKEAENMHLDAKIACALSVLYSFTLIWLGPTNPRNSRSWSKGPPI